MLDRAFLRSARRLAVTAQIAGHHFVGLLEMLELRLPVVRAAGEAVDEDDGRSAFARADEVHLRYYRYASRRWRTAMTSTRRSRSEMRYTPLGRGLLINASITLTMRRAS